MLQGKNQVCRTGSVVVLAALLCMVASGLGCAGAISGSAQNRNGDPLHLGVTPGPLGTTDPQLIQVRLGSEPSDRIVSLWLTIPSLQATNSGAENLDLLVDPVMVEFTRSAISTVPVAVRTIYQDTYSTLILPDMTGQAVFYDDTGRLVTQSLSVPGQALPYSFVLGAEPLVLSLDLDLAQSFPISDPGTIVVANPLIITADDAVVDPGISQPETGSFTFLVGAVTNVDPATKTLSIQPSSGNPMDITYDDAGGTQFINCDPSMLVDMLIETEGTMQSNGAVLATKVSLIDTGEGSELYGLLSGPGPDGIAYNFVAEGGVGFNVSTELIGKNITIDWLAAGYSVNDSRLNRAQFDDLVFDEARTFPGQFVAAQWDALIVPDPDSSNAGYMQPKMLELQEQTITGQVSNYVYDPDTQTATFTLRVAGNAPLMTLNPGIVSVTVRQLPPTYLRNSPTFADGDAVKVRGLLFADPNYNNANYHPPDPVAFIMVADRISK